MTEAFQSGVILVKPPWKRSKTRGFAKKTNPFKFSPAAPKRSKTRGGGLMTDVEETQAGVSSTRLGFVE